MPLIQLPEWQVLYNTADLSSATWNTVATHELFVVTGGVDVEIQVRCTETLTDVSDMGAISLGLEGATTTLIASTSFSPMAGEGLQANRFWYSNAPLSTDGYVATATATLTKSIANGLDIGYEITGGAATDGTLVFRCRWRPTSTDGSITLGAGGSL